MEFADWAVRKLNPRVVQMLCGAKDSGLHGVEAIFNHFTRTSLREYARRVLPLKKISILVQVHSVP